MSEKRTYQSRERVYRPNVDVLFASNRLEMRLTDKTGVLHGFANHYPAGAYRKESDGTVMLLVKSY